MAKGRSFAPQPRSGNHWFCAKPWLSPTESHARATFKPIPPPPPGFQARASLQTSHNQFPFSRHDNRNAFQDHGVYFGNGLGRRFLQQQRNKCSGSLVPLGPTKPTSSCYTSSFSVPPISEDAKYTQKCRRYTHNHWDKSMKAERPNTEIRLLKSSATPYQTPLHVLAVSQEPFLRTNTWVYSYKPKEYNRFLGT